MTCFELPFPVPLHALFIKSKGGGGVPTPRYRAYSHAAYAKILQQRPAKLSGRVSIHVQLCAPDKRKRDIDNLGKCLLDTLKNNGVVEDDSNRHVRKLTLEWVDDGPPCVVCIGSAGGVA